MRSFFVRLLALLLLVSLLAGCAPAPAPTDPGETQPSVAAPTDAPTDAPTEPPTEASTEAPTEAPAEPLPDCTRLNGADISEFTIVCAADAPEYTRRAAEFVQETILERVGVELPIRTPEDGEGEYEILVGHTPRHLSQAVNPPTASLEFAVASDGKKVALEGEYFLIAAAAYYFIYHYIPDRLFDSQVPEEIQICTPVTHPVKSIMFLIGDGMGFEQTMLVGSQHPGADYPDDPATFYGYRLPYRGQVRTGSISGTTDSAASGTALACGIKTINRYVAKNVNREDALSITELAASLGKATAVMSTEDSTGATVACFSSHAKDRNDDKDILAGQDKMAQEYGTLIVCDFEAMEPKATAFREPLLQTLEALEASENGFFLMYEEAYIDKNAHKRNVQGCFEAMVRFQQAIGLFMEYACYHPDTLVLITADHETGGLTQIQDGSFTFTGTEHTSAEVPLFVFGRGGEMFQNFQDENNKIPQMLVTLWGVTQFGE